MNPGAVGLEAGHHGELVKRQLHSAAGGGGGDSSDLDGVAVKKYLEHGEVLFRAEGAEDVVQPIVAICTGGQLRPALPAGREADPSLAEETVLEEALLSASGELPWEQRLTAEPRANCHRSRPILPG